MEGERPGWQGHGRAAPCFFNVIEDHGDEDAEVGIDVVVFLTVQKLRSNEDSLGHLLATRKVA